MAERRTDWHGVFVPVVTPFTKDYEFDEKACRQILDILISDGVHGIIVAGSTGEWFTMNDSERIRLFEVAKNHVRGRVTLLGGTSAIATRDAVSLTKEAKNIGLDGALVLPPPYALPNEKEVMAYYAAIANVGLPIMAYNNPARTQININARLAEKLASFSSVVAFKDSTKDLYQMAETIRTVGNRLAMFCGLEPYALPLIQRGAVGIVAMAPNIMGGQAVALYTHAVAGQWAEAAKLVGIIDRLYTAFYAGGYGAYVVIKECMNLVGRPGGWPRPPLLPMGEDDRKELKRVLQEIGLL